MPPPRHRTDLTRGLPLPSTWVNKIMSMLGSAADNILIVAASPTAIGVRAADESTGWAVLAIDGAWRFMQSFNVTHPGGAAGTYNVYATTHANDLSAVDPADTETYTFSLTIRAVADGEPPASGETALARLVATCDWDGSAITRVVQLVGARTKVINIPHTWAVAGDVRVPSGQSDVIPPIRMAAAAAETLRLVNVSYRLGNGAAGTTVTFSMQREGADIAGITGITTLTNTGWASAAPSAATPLLDGQVIVPVVTAISGSPANLSITAVIEHTVG
jgi:hypothetical protein